MYRFVQLLLACLVIAVSMSMAWAAGCSFTIADHLGHEWTTGLVHQSIDVPKAGLLPVDTLQLTEGQARVPMQLIDVKTYPDGSLQHATIWFQTNLPANGSRTFTLATGDDTQTVTAVPANVQLTRRGNIYELGNGLITLRVPAGTWQADEGTIEPAKAVQQFSAYCGIEAATNQLPGPLLGMLLPSKRWTAAAAITPESLPKSVTSTILVQGTLLTRIRIVYTFAGDGQYAAELSLRAGESYLRIDEQYTKAGCLSIQLPGIQPASIGYEGFRPSEKGKSVPIDLAKPGKLVSLIGYNYILSGIAPAVMLNGDPSGDLVALLSTDTNWLPAPYNQALAVSVLDDKRLALQGSLAVGQRHWALFAGEAKQFPAPEVKSFYRWWWAQFVIPFDKVMNWSITWPDMEIIAFPHTFFGNEDLPAISQRMQAEPVITEFMTVMTDPRRFWPIIQGYRTAAKSPEAIKRAYEEYRTKYYPKGVATSYSDVAAAYLYSGDELYLRQLAENYPLAYDEYSPIGYLNHVLQAALEGDAYFEDDYMSYMNMTDGFLRRLVGLDFLLGSQLLSPAERRSTLSKLAFVVYLLNDPMFQPPNVTDVAGYGQGTPNMKHCLIAVRGMMACMLTNHPAKRQWMDYTMVEYNRNLQISLNTNGVHLESPFYSSRDTMRFGPFWLAMTRAGVNGDLAKQWLDREKHTFQYLGDMLTPPEPRMGGRRVYHPIGRSSSGVVDQTFMIGADPWGDTDAAHGRLMRWLWESVGKPEPPLGMGGGGRDTALTLLAFSKLLKFPTLTTPPLRSKRWEGMGAIFRSQVGSTFESNVLFRHDPFCWDLYPVNNGAVYFYGKGAPLCPRFGGYWMAQQGQCNMMSLPFGNRLQYLSGNNNASGKMTDYASLGNLVDIASGVTGEQDWRRSVLFAKDLDRDDPVYLLVRDDVSRPDVPTALHWWVMSKDVQPDGIETPGVVPTKGNDASWSANLGKNWKDAPKLTGQRQHFTGQCGVDLDMFIALPVDPVIVTDAAGIGPGLSYCVNPKLYEYQQLIRIEQPAGKSYLTLLVPRWPGSTDPRYRTIADGRGVAITTPAGEDRLFVSNVPVKYTDTTVSFDGCMGFLRQGGPAVLRLMVMKGAIRSGGITLTSTEHAALIFDGKGITVYCSTDTSRTKVQLSPALKRIKITTKPEGTL
ncbi:MAG: hypothetical protein ACYC7E_11985 [Armatimonadota bacterium]